ncbi:GPALPP motifs-containing protein 1 [Daktulosphaira vitifoliae]|uniref:GPALPP motifs-containing protein 1 n=1 Tax=Daktulosphaira vitifoliae TaxID=58002 RepID=UPI0021AA8396|nr:GPALPP motifs-containing protein 1 [Daktulosphaira vitifoliae]
MGKDRKKHKKHKHSKHNNKSKNVNYPTPIVPIKKCPQRIETSLEVQENTSIGPVMPSTTSNTIKNESSSRITEENLNEYGPSLPPHLVQQNKIIPGPSLPPGFLVNERVEEAEEDVSNIGPLPDDLISSDSEQMFIQTQLELRANYMKKKFAGEIHEENTVSAREKWMLELPPEKATNIGLGPRQFRKREGPDMRNRSEWTDTPLDKMKKKDNPTIDETTNTIALRQIAIKKRNMQMEKMAETSEKRKPYSLVEIHQEKLKKEKKKKSEKKSPQERRPFSRDIDLQSNRFDNAQKQSILKKASQLNNRFSQGESKFL